MWRCSAEMIPVVSVRLRPNGLPIASTGSPTWTLLESPSVSGCSVSPSVGTRSTARSLEGSLPITFASIVLEFSKLTVTLTAFSTTCQLVRIVPFALTTNPEPVAVPCSWLSPKPNGDSVCLTMLDVT